MIGIIILNYETWNLSLRCMKSLKQQEDAKQYRIYLIDNASKTQMPKEVEQYIQNNEIRFISNSQNLGYAAGNNVGIQKALEDGCDALLISNNDIVYKSKAVERLYQALCMDSQIGIVGPKVLDKNGEMQVSCVSRKTDIKEIFQLYTIAKVLFRKQWRTYFCIDRDTEKSAYVYHVSGCCFMISAKCAKQVLPFDEKTKLYDEELILGIRMEQAGYRTLYQPQSVVIHKHGATTRKVRPFMYQCISESELYYCCKYLHASKWQLWILKEYRKILYLLRALNQKELRQYYSIYKKTIQKMWLELMGEDGKSGIA